MVPFDAYFRGGDSIAKCFSGNRPAVLVANDAFIVTGGNLLQAFDRLEVAEFSAKSSLMAKHLGEMLPISDEQVEALRKTFLQSC